jgi:thiol-activated cytolysin
MIGLARTVALVGLVAAACTGSDDPTTDGNPDGTAIDELIAGIGTLPADEPRRVEGTAGAPVLDGDYRCTTTPVDEVRRFDQLLGQISVGDVLWPGDLLRGDSVSGGQLTPVALSRAPVTFSVSLESLSGSHSAKLDKPSLSTYRDALGAILAQDLEGSAPAKIYAELDEVSSEQQLAVSLGASVSAPLVAQVKAGFRFADTKQRARYLVKFFQIYYTVDVDPLSSPSAFFTDDVTVDQVAAQVGATNPPVYVSSIAYGRQVLFTFESELSQQELQAALDFVYHGGAEVSGSVSLTHQEVLSKTHTTAFILGGNSGEAAMASIGSYEELKDFIGRGGEYTKDSPGAAIAYKLSYVRDNMPVRVSYATEYEHRSCERVSQRIHVTLDKITVDAGGTIEVYGDVRTNGSTFEQPSLFSRGESNYVAIQQGGKFPPSGIVGEAIIPVRPSAGNSLRVISHLFDDQGIFPSDDLGALTTSAPFEAGWRRTLQVHHTAGGKVVTLHLSLLPI